MRQAVREVEEALVKLQSHRRARAATRDTAVQNYQASFDATAGALPAAAWPACSNWRTRAARCFAAQTALVALQRERAEAWIALYRAHGRRLGAGAGSRATASDAPTPPPAHDHDTTTP